MYDVRCAIYDVRCAMYDLRFTIYGVPPHGTTLRLRLVRGLPGSCPFGTAQGRCSSSRHHTAASPCAGLLGFCPFGAAQGRCSSSRHHTAASPCAGLLGFCPFGAAQGNSQFSILTVSFVGTIILLMLNWRGTRPGSWSRMCVIFSRLFLEMTVRAFVCTVSPPPSTL